MRENHLKKEIPQTRKHMSSSTTIIKPLLHNRENKDPNQIKKLVETKPIIVQTRNPFLSLDQKNILIPTHLPFHA